MSTADAAAAAAASSEHGSSAPLRILVTFPLPPPTLELLQQTPNLDIRTCEGDMEKVDLFKEQLRKHAPIDGLICRPGNTVDKEALDLAGDKLRAISSYSVGYNHIDLATASTRGIRVGFCPDSVTETTADTALLLLLTAARRFPEAAANVLGGQWGKTPFDVYQLCGRDVHHSTVGIVGLGRIGQAVARRLHGFGCKILYSGRREKPQEAAACGGADFVAFDELLARSDFVLPQVPMSDETRHLFDATAFTRMKRTAIFVNTTRGGVVDQQALYEALRDGTILAAALDVTDPEPISPNSPLLSLPNCIVLPHIGTSTYECRHTTGRQTVFNLLQALQHPDDGGKGTYCNNIPQHKH